MNHWPKSCDMSFSHCHEWINAVTARTVPYIQQHYTGIYKTRQAEHGNQSKIIHKEAQYKRKVKGFFESKIILLYSLHLVKSRNQKIKFNFISTNNAVPI